MAKTRVTPRFKAPRRRLFLKEWREYRNMTQEQLAEAVGMSVSNISQLERGIQGYSQDGLEALAEALKCEPGHLHMVDPSKDDAIWSIWEQAQPAEKLKILGYAQGVTGKTGTDD